MFEPETMLLTVLGLSVLFLRLRRVHRRLARR